MNRALNWVVRHIVVIRGLKHLSKRSSALHGLNFKRIVMSLLRPPFCGCRIYGAKRTFRSWGKWFARYREAEMPCLTFLAIWFFSKSELSLSEVLVPGLSLSTYSFFGARASLKLSLTRNLTPGKLTPENLLPKTYSRRFSPAKTRSYENPLPEIPTPKVQVLIINFLLKHKLILIRCLHWFVLSVFIYVINFVFSVAFFYLTGTSYSAYRLQHLDLHEMIWIIP
jgi:hypothetical protein